MLPDLKVELEKLTGLGRLREFHARGVRKDGLIEIKGRRLIDFTNWDFFNLNSDKTIRRLCQAEIDRTGFGSGSPRLCSGTTAVHVACEARIAKFLGTEAALLFSSKNQAVLSLATGLLSDQVAVFYDDLLQSPLADASSLVNAQNANFRGADLSSLEIEINKWAQFKHKYIFIESVSPISGVNIDLTAIANTADRYGAQLIVDESYGLGTLGLRGAGGCEQLSLQSRIFCMYGDLSLGIGMYGAFVAGPKILIDYLVARSRTFSHEIAMPAVIPIAIEAAIDKIELMIKQRESLAMKSRKLRRELSGVGLSDNDILPLFCLSFDNFTQALELEQALFQRGFLVEALLIPYPFGNRGVVRILLNSLHTEKHIEDLLQAISDIRAKIE